MSYFRQIPTAAGDDAGGRPITDLWKGASMVVRDLVASQAHTVMDSPVGPLTLVAAGGTLAGLYMNQQRHRPPHEMFGERDDSLFTEVVSQLRAYFTGTRTEFDLPLTLIGTPFQQRVWCALRSIPYGQTITYGQLADRIGQPAAARAVGLANGRNPIGIIVPCHRVVGADGGLTGYGGGLERKQYLLAFERSTATS
jgi:methylated-DNA-[protein]-cysteine S-methyltransferase